MPKSLDPTTHILCGPALASEVTVSWPASHWNWLDAADARLFCVAFCLISPVYDTRYSICEACQTILKYVGFSRDMATDVHLLIVDRVVDHFSVLLSFWPDFLPDEIGQGRSRSRPWLGFRARFGVGVCSNRLKYISFS